MGYFLRSAEIHYCNHPNLKDSKHFELYCLPHLVPFYKKWGFDDEVEGVVFMRSGSGEIQLPTINDNS